MLPWLALRPGPVEQFVLKSMESDPAWRLRLTTPSFTAVLRGMKQAISASGYPAVDVPALLLQLRDVAIVYGDAD